MKKVILMALVAMSLFAAKTVNKADVPIPICDECGGGGGAR